jgi:hypothetical protein
MAIEWNNPIFSDICRKNKSVEHGRLPEADLVFFLKYLQPQRRFFPSGDAKVVATDCTEAHLTSGSAEHQKFSGGAPQPPKSWEMG